MTFLVTGCAGFIGWKVCAAALEAGHTVIGVDNLDNSYDRRLKEWRLNEIGGCSRFALNSVDIRDRSELSRLFTKHQIQAVINLAARAGVRQSTVDPWCYYDTNVIGTLNLLEACRQSGVQKFVLASTSSVYGQGEQPQREDHPTDYPLSAYAASKKSAEVTCHTYHWLYGIDVTVLRYFTVYGPAGRPDMSIFRFIKSIAEEEPIHLYGDGYQQRDFTYVEDIARGTLAAIEPMGYQVINLGCDRPVVIRDVMSLIEGHLEKVAIIESKPAHPADVRATWADVTKAKEVLGWSAKVPFEEGLRRSVEWYLKHRDWARTLT